MNYKKIIMLLGSGVLLVVVYGCWIEPFHAETNHVYLNNLWKGGSLKGKTIVLLSDFHMSEISRFEENILTRVNALKPDLICLTGDYVSWKGDVDPALDLLSQFKAKYGIVGVMGDYDYSDSRKSCLFCHKKGTGESTTRHGVQMLKNAVMEADLGNGMVKIAGKDDGPGVPGAFLENIEFSENADPLIVLSHSPLFFDKLPNAGKILMLSGDTHGGQIYLPSLVWRMLGYEKNAKYNSGLYQRGEKFLYVTRGIGTSHVRFRLFCPPEITVLHF